MPCSSVWQPEIVGVVVAFLEAEERRRFVFYLVAEEKWAAESVRTIFKSKVHAP